MKKISGKLGLVFLVILIVLAVSSCGKSKAGEEKKDLAAESGEDLEKEDSEEENSEKEQIGGEQPEETGDNTQESEEKLTGDIQELGEKQFVINKAFEDTDEYGGKTQAVPLESEDMTLVTVFYDESTVFSRRMIRDGGASYEDSESSPEELKIDSSVEIKGFYENGEFHALEIQINEVIS